MRVFAIIPAYNEEQRLGPVVTRTLPFVETVVVVDDGSRDRTSEVASDAGASVVVQNPNQGKGAALERGFQVCLERGADAVVTLDADGQHEPEDIPRLLEALHNGADIAIGSRRSETARMPWLRRMTNLFLSWLLSRMAGQLMEDTQSGYRVYRRQVLKQVKTQTARFEAESEILLRAARKGFKLAWVPIKALYLEGRESHINPFRDTLRFIRMFWCILWEP